VVIVGAGLGGTAVAVRLLQFAREPLQVVLVERTPAQRSAGIAYHKAGNPWYHVFNIQAGRMSMFREDVDDFVRWANVEADRTGWPPDWRGFTFTEPGPAPRRLYADYLSARLAGAAREAHAGVTLVEADGEVVDIVADEHGTHVVVEDFALPRADVVLASATIRADHVIIATGLGERELPCAAGVLDHPSFVRHPYSEAGVERLLGVRPDATVAIIGTVLTAYDSAALLLRRNHTGTIHMISRSGLTLRAYPPDHTHQVLDLPPPRLHAAAYEGRDHLVRCVADEWERACALVEKRHPDVASAVVTERVAKSWEPYLPAFLARVPTDDLRVLLDRYATLLATLRVGAVAYTTEIVEAAMADGGQITRTVGNVDTITATGRDRLALTVSTSDSPRTIEADLVVSNFGREPDCGRTGGALWLNLLRRNIVTAHRRTGRGVEVDGSGTVLGPGGVPAAPVSVVGGPREGDEIVRHGRIGAFSFNLAAIKNHSVGVAASVLHRLESCYDDQADDLAATTRTHAAFDRSVLIDVHRMAARRANDREALAARLEDSLAAVREAGLPGSDRALRFAVNRAAVRRLNDLSVTPRELSVNLGLDTPPGA
jgi:uncharacterized NAD(P)/FAD-binding protein YdhS